MSFLGFILGGKDGGIIGGLLGAFIGGVCRFDFTNLFKSCCKKVRFIPKDVIFKALEVKSYIQNIFLSFSVWLKI